MINGYVGNLGGIAEWLSSLWVYRDGISVFFGFLVFAVWDWWQSLPRPDPALNGIPRPHQGGMR